MRTRFSSLATLLLLVSAAACSDSHDENGDALLGDGSAASQTGGDAASAPGAGQTKTDAGALGGFGQFLGDGGIDQFLNDAGGVDVAAICAQFGQFLPQCSTDGGFDWLDGGFQRPDGGFQRPDGGFQRPDGGFRGRDGG